MIDHLAHVVEVVENEVHRAAVGEESQFGRTVFQAVLPIMTSQGPSLAIHWIIGLTLRNPLVGMPPFNEAEPPIPGAVPPSDARLRMITGQLIDGLLRQRNRQEAEIKASVEVPHD